MELKPGYKQTEVGVIPEDWEVKSLHQVSARIMVGIASAATHAYRDKGVVMFRNQNIKPGYLDDSDLLYITEDYEQAFKNKRLKGGDLLTARTGYPGTTSIVPSQYEGAQSFTTLITRPNPELVDPAYLCIFMNSEAGQTYFEQNQIGGGQKNVNAGSLKQLPVALPPKITEQRAIAAVLSDADALIESLEQLLGKKRQIKQGAMQELLTGKKRLPGFAGKWKEQSLDEIGYFLKGRGVSRDQSNTGELPCVRYGELYTDHHEHLHEYRSWISQDVAASAVLIKQGDILFAGSGETKEEIGKCAAILQDIEAYAGGDIVILRTGYQDPRFLGYYLNTPSINRQKASRGQGDAVVHISSTALAGIRCFLPQMVEQIAIADVLTDMDAEINSLETKLAKACRLKQGVMQELLTGRIRLVRPSAQILSFPAKESASATDISHNTHFNEAVVIAVLSAKFGSETFPLGRFRRTKFSYLLHRHVEHEAAGFMKKAAGPYNPRTRYGGAEKIALQNRYVRVLSTGKSEGFVADENIAQAEGYFEKWYGAEALTWLEQFRYQKNDSLELLTTVDMACEDLSREGKAATLSAVKQIIQDSPEWKAKLNRAVFSDDNIATTIQSCGQLFPIEEE